jgi:hypothetical protein
MSTPQDRRPVVADVRGGRDTTPEDAPPWWGGSLSFLAYPCDECPKHQLLNISARAHRGSSFTFRDTVPGLIASIGEGQR